MGKVTKRHKDVLNQLVLDCSIYNFNEQEALGYIKTRFGKQISGRTYRRHKKNLEDGHIAQQWMSHYTRIGYIVTHQNVLETAKQLLASSMRRLLQEESKEKQDDILTLKLKHEIMENIKLVAEISLGTPVLSGIKERMEILEKRIKQKEEILRNSVLNHSAPKINHFHHDSNPSNRVIELR